MCKHRLIYPLYIMDFIDPPKDSKKFNLLGVFFKGAKLFSVDESSSALFFYKKSHHLSSSDTIKVEFFKRFDFTFKILLLSVSFRF